MMKANFIIIYSTQTGQAKAIAESISDLARKNKYNAELTCITDYEDNIEKLNQLNMPCVFICSTTGDGEVPQMAVKCYNKLKKAAKSNKDFELDHFNYALLGLGDTNYAQFCNGPKLFHKCFQQLNANCFYGPRWADDGTGLEVEVEPFIEGLWQALDKYLNTSDDDSLSNKLNNLDINESNTMINTPLYGIELTVPQLNDQQISIEYVNDTDECIKLNEINFINALSPNLYEACLTAKTILTSDDAVKTCYQLKFSSEFQYDAGHAIDILCPNNETELTYLFECLNLSSQDLNKPIKLKLLDETKKSSLLNIIKLNNNVNYSLYYLFKHYFDIRSNTLKKALIRMLAESCTNEFDKRCLLELCSKEGTQLYQDQIKQNALSLVDLLKQYKTCKPRVEYLIQFLSPLQPRSYSLCSASGDEMMEIIFNLVKFDATQMRYYERLGVATGYLSQLNVNDKFYFLKRNLQNFTLPLNNNNDDKNSPIIMIGPGTGIAPFISFLRHKKRLVTNDKNLNSSDWYLYYGCRDPNKDFLYKNELCDEYAKNEKILKNFYVSFSRYNNHGDDELLKQLHSQNTFKYVQDALKANSNEIKELIRNRNAYIYVCGDARNMAKDVFTCLANCIQEPNDDSNKYLIELMSKKRYKQDIWN